MRTPRRLLLCYGVALLATALAAEAAEAFGPTLRPAPFLAFTLAVVVSARWGGVGPGILSTLLGAVASDFLLMSPTYSFHLEQAGDFLRLALFVGVGAAISVMVGQLQTARRAARFGAADAHAQAEQFRVTLLSIGDAVVAANARGRVTFLNAVAESLTGWPLAEALGRPLADVFRISSATTARRVVDPAGATTANGSAVRLTSHAILQSRQGTFHPIDHTASPVRDVKGGIVGSVVVFRDVSEQRRAEDAMRFLAEAGEVLASSLDVEATLVAATRLAVPRLADLSSVYLAGEDGALRQLALTHRDPAKADLAREVGRRHPPDPADRAGVARVLRTGRAELFPEITEEMLASAARAEAHLRGLRGLGVKSAMIVPLNARGRTLGAISFAMAESGRHYGPADLALAEDLARRTALAVDNARLYHDAQEADRRKDEFLAMLAHELRNPLAPVRNALHLLTLECRSETVERDARAMIERQVRHLARLVDDLLDVSRISRGKVQVRPERLDLVRHIRGGVEDRRGHLVEGGLTLDLDLPDGPLWVDADPTRLAQILDNLLGNAAKFTDPGGRVTVRVWREDGRAVVRVEDDGVGVAPEMLPKVWDTFAQADTSLDRGRGGLGLGLALVRALIGLHGGGVSAESTGPGKGSAFGFWLPVADGPAAPAPTPGPPVPDVGPLTILIVEDNRDAAESLRLLLELSGRHRVSVAHEGRKGLDEARRLRPDVMLCDLGLPGLSGYDVARALRQDADLAATYLVAVSGYGQPEDRERSRRAGFDLHLVKPVEIDELRRLLASRRKVGVSSS
jgi:PAS domain S-box-containing protein